MPVGKRWLFWLRIAALVFCALGAALSAYVPVQQRILRGRVQQLLADVRTIQLGNSTWAEAQPFIGKWRNHSYVSGTCTETLCDYHVELQDGLWLLGSAFEEYAHIWNLLDRPYLLLGGRGTLATAHLEIHNGIISESEFSLFLIVPPSPFNHRDGYGIVGIASHIAGRFDPYTFRGQRLIHPEYWIGKPGGCEGCIKLMSSTSPRAEKKKIYELTDFELSCITRWSPCTTEADVLPSAWRQYQQELVSNQAREEAFQECRIPLEFWGREYESIAIADVISVASRSTQTLGHGQYLEAQVRVVSGLKGQMDWPLNKAYKVSVYDRGQGIPGWRSTDLAAGRRYILLGSFSFFKDNPIQKVLALDDCGVVPYSEQNLTEIRHGIAETPKK